MIGLTIGGFLPMIPMLVIEDRLNAQKVFQDIPALTDRFCAEDI